MSGSETKINCLLMRIQMERENAKPPQSPGSTYNLDRPPRQTGRPSLPLGNLSNPGTPSMKRPDVLQISKKQPDTLETDRKLKEIMKSSGKLKINDVTYNTDMKDMEYIEELGHGTCGQVVKMRHKPSGEIIAVKQMRRSVNTEENKRIVMDIEVVIKSYDCKYIVQCLGCFITNTEVWICMELMSTCFDKLLKRLQQPIPEHVLGKVTVATVKALSYLKDKHGVIHRDVKPSNILLDERGNVKLCDFGISGRLVDSRAKTRSAGCAAYMAPERIELSNSDYDIRADVWSLGITLVELATGALPYQDCKNDFEVLARVIGQDPPTLPVDVEFSSEFKKFVSACLIKDYKQRPKYLQLQNESFIKKYEKAGVSVDEWFANAIRQADAVAASRSTPRHTPSPSLTRQIVQPNKSQAQQTAQPLFINGSSSNSPLLHLRHETSTEQTHPEPEGPNRRSNHVSRLSTFRNSDVSNHQRDSHLPHQSTIRSYSPLQTYQNHLLTKNASEQTGGVKSPGFLEQSPLSSPLFQRKYTEGHSGHSSGLSSPFMDRRSTGDNNSRWSSPLGSPLPLRNHCQNDEQPAILENTSPIVLQRFYHQQKQQQQAREAEETGKFDAGKKRFASYIKLQLSGERIGRSSRHQSPEPPPRLHRGLSGDQSPLAVRRNYIDCSTPGSSPGLSRRYVSPTPPIPPPRRLSESSSVPGSPQHLRARFHYTPEPQRRLFQNNDVS